MDLARKYFATHDDYIAIAKILNKSFGGIVWARASVVGVCAIIHRGNINRIVVLLENNALFRPYRVKFVSDPLHQWINVR